MVLDSDAIHIGGHQRATTSPSIKPDSRHIKSHNPSLKGVCSVMMERSNLTIFPRRCRSGIYISEWRHSSLFLKNHSTRVFQFRLSYRFKYVTVILWKIDRVQWNWRNIFPYLDISEDLVMHEHSRLRGGKMENWIIRTFIVYLLLLLSLGHFHCWCGSILWKLGCRDACIFINLNTFVFFLIIIDFLCEIMTAYLAITFASESWTVASHNTK